MKLRRLYIFSILFSLVTGLSGCMDDEIYKPEEIGEGVANISATVQFDSYVPALTTRAEAGTIIHNIENMMVLVYDANDDEKESELVTKEYFDQSNIGIDKDWTCDNNLNEDKPSDVSDPAYDPDKDNPHWTDEGKTPRASFKIKNLPFGKYYIYVVANVGELSDEDIAHPYNLKHVVLNWNNGNIAANNQMFGYFTLDNDRSSAGFQSKTPVTINSNEVKLHAWIKRAVSKVTIAFDASKLNESVFIYIKKATIRDVPITCLLGAKNEPDSYKDLYIAPGYGKEHKDVYGDADNPDANVSQTISYVKAGTDEDNMNNWLEITKGSGKVGSHTNSGEALFFYENMQGDWKGKGDEYNKVMQDEVKFGDTPIRVPDQVDFKDKIPYGTYIEVEGYYESRNADRVTKGPIKYRFMLGKNTTYNYDAERNHHYKLTLVFNGFANEADWHIDYEHTPPALEVPSKFYVPYVYGTRAGDGLPVHLTGKVKSLKAEIIENNWAPYSDDPNDSENGVLKDKHPGGDFYWNLKAYDFLNEEYGDDKVYTVKDKTYNCKDFFGHANFVGFLSLREVNQAYIFDPEPTKEETGDDHGYGAGMMKLLIQKYVDNKLYFVDNYELSAAGINIPIDGVATYGTYDVKIDEDGSVTVMVPMWTRNKCLGRMTGFTGNNPYAPYQRKAVVRFTATFENDEVDAEGKPLPDIVKTEEVPVFQVRRIENPKGIWYSKNKTDKFDVTLCHWTDPDSPDYTEFNSEGKWRVSVEPVDGVSPDWVWINGSALSNGSYVEGTTGTPIKFTYQPSGPATEDRCAVIKVEYHDYSCVHKIFVRQGYEEDIKLCTTPKKNGEYTLWSSHNVYGFVTTRPTDTENSEPSDVKEASCRVTESPLSIGSLFKRCQYNYAVLEKNNEKYGFEVTPGDLDLGYYANTTTTTMSMHVNKTWASFSGFAQYNKYGSSRLGIEWAARITALNAGNEIYRVPGYEDFEQLLSNDSNIDFGYGIVYGDGATKVNKSVVGAESFSDNDNDNNKGKGSQSGVKACVVYNSKTANQILFPLGGARNDVTGGSGYGRRQKERTDLNIPPGVLLYGGVMNHQQMDREANYYRPIIYNIMYSNGAIYWINKIEPKGHKSDGADAHGWDINYFSFDFGAFDNGALGAGGNGFNAANSSDALPIKLVRDSTK